jgi:predicted DNA-binding WGR domain protein
MMSFSDYLNERLVRGGFTTEDALASVLPLFRQTAVAHRAGQVAPLQGINDLKVEGNRIWFEEARRQNPSLQKKAISRIEQPIAKAMEIIGEFKVTADVDGGEVTVQSLQIGKRGEEITRPVYLPGYVCWEHEVGHHDPLTDTYSLGMILGSLVCGLDLNDPENLRALVQHRSNLFALNPNLHPVLAKAVVRMTELGRSRRAQDLEALIRALENYRDQDIDFDFDLARIPEWKSADAKGRRGLILTRLQQRLFEISRRNRLLHFRPTMQTVNLTLASVPLSFDPSSIQPEQILTWNSTLQEAIVAGSPISLNKHLRFEEAVYLPSLFDQIRNEASRDQAEFGFAQLRLVLCFLRWSNLKEKPPERFDSPLVLVPVRLTKTKGVRDVYALEAQTSDAEINPVLRHYLKQLYDIDLPEGIDLSNTPLETLYDYLAAKIQASEPAVTVAKIDRPRIQLIQARAQRRLDQYRRRVRLSGRGIRSFLDLDYSYDPENYHPLGLRLFQAHIRPPETQLQFILADKPRPRTFMLPSPQSPAVEKERLLYSLAEEEANPFRWEFDLCNITLGNFRYRKMSLVRDYAALLENGNWPSGLEALFSLEPRTSQSVRAQPPALEDSHPIVPWDPTQASAIAFSRSGGNYIIQGPPGTGKSQTITNLIADFVVRGKRVLFVCAKRAAIDVVYHRLQQAGLQELCCLIHDSQADKREFISDLKQTYEGFLQDQETRSESGALQARQKVLAGMKQELAPLQHFHAAMCSTPAQAGIPLRRLVRRAIELVDHDRDLSPLEREGLPSYVHWHVHREGIERLASSLHDVQGNDVLGRHPLRNLSPALVVQNRPLEFVSQQMRTVEKLLDSIAAQMPPLENEEPGPLQSLIDLTGYAASIRFLAERKQLSLFRPESELAQKLADLRREQEMKEKELDRARESTKGWRHKLSAEETKTALDQARGFEGQWFAFFQPSWWRLRAVLRRCYDFRKHTVKPSWTQVLEKLNREHEVQEVVQELESQAHARFGYEGTFADYVARIYACRTNISRLPTPVQALHRRILENPAGEEVILHLAGLKPIVEELVGELEKFLENSRGKTMDLIRDELSLIDESLDELPDFMTCLSELARLPRPLAEAFRLDMSMGCLEAAVARRSLEVLFRSDRALGKFSRTIRDRQIQRLEQHHDHFHHTNAAVVRDCVRRRFLEHVRLAGLPHAQLTAEQKEFKVAYNRGRRELEHEFGKTMRYKSIRDLAAGDSGLVLQDLKPVWLMSPLSVSDTLPFDSSHFDVVIFDEASQVPLEEAVPALFRAGQAIVVGDEMQLPPTNFFSARQSDDEEKFLIEEEGGVMVEYELSGNSFLNHAARNLPATLLGWHYRSRSESLISFSNRAFYEGRLLTVPEVTLPAPDLGEIRVQESAQGSANVAQVLGRPVSYHFLTNGIYQQRGNTQEADYIAKLVQGLLARETGLSIGIIAFSEAQQSEIEAALRRLAEKDRAFRDRLDAEFDREEDGQFVGLLVKNLENIQGDERDVVILSVCYGNAPNGKMLMNFGPINQSGGERRLNVAFSRAKQHMVVVASIRYQHITNDYNEGARCLKNYLRYAESASAGDLAAVQRVLWELTFQEEKTGEETASDAVLDQLADSLVRRGYQVDRAVGQSGFRCDLAVRRPEEHVYCLAILLDTDAYYQNPDPLERDVLKPKLLRAFGWKVAQVLTKDWLENRDGVLDWLERLARGEVEASNSDLAEDRTGAPAPLTMEKVEEGRKETQPSGISESPAKSSTTADMRPAWKRRFEFVVGSSNKFWEICLSGNQHVVRFGRIGTEGQSKTKTFADPRTAEKDAFRLVQEKLAKGYVER